MGTLTYSPLSGDWLSGAWGRDSTPTSPARQRLAARFDMSLPANQRKLEVVEELGRLAGDAGLSLIELAIAFVIRHPGVTSAIIGPRTMAQLESQLPAADVTLGDDVLERIDELVAPGVTINPEDNSYGTRSSRRQHVVADSVYPDEEHHHGTATGDQDGQDACRELHRRRLPQPRPQRRRRLACRGPGPLHPRRPHQLALARQRAVPRLAMIRMS